ncbi:MAG: hypothetical protein HQ523_16115 [Lentisphaerae bacterium]|nr:hypothetical protein [Lentisphaerota bacterium]
MKIRIIAMLVIALCVIGATERAGAIELKSGDNTLNVNGRLQLLAALEGVHDHEWKDSGRLFLFLQQARVSLNGNLGATDYEIQWMMGGEEIPEGNSVMSLLDAYANIPLIEDTLEVKAGQLKVPYGREKSQDSGTLFNADRSIHDNFFKIGRDVGGAIHTTEGIFTAAVGLFTGGGINIPERYIPENLELPMFVARVGVNNGLDKDVFTPFETPEDENDGIKFAAFLNGMFSGDSRVGHSTPLNVKYHDKSLMLNADYNPYIKARDERAEVTQFGADAAVQLGLTDTCDLLLAGEVNVATFNNGVGDLKTSGGVASASLISGDWVFGIRYAVVNPDREMAYKGEDGTLYQIFPKAITEITPSVVYFVPDSHLKIVADFAWQMDVPVTLEPGHGVYNLMRTPGQASRAAKGGIELQDNYLASLMFQYDF